jgi:2-C-methyl-D-erythritol 4-phosphate cytidylyltransferase
VVVVEGEPANLKITRPADLDLARLELERIVAGSSHA